MSGVDLPDGTKIRKGAAEAIEKYVKAMGDLSRPTYMTK